MMSAMTLSPLDFVVLHNVIQVAPYETRQEANIALLLAMEQTREEDPLEVTGPRTLFAGFTGGDIRIPGRDGVTLTSLLATIKLKLFY
jgi:hypothetical protein